MLAAFTSVYFAVLGSLTLSPQPAAAGGTLRRLAAWFSGWPPTAWLTFDVLEFAANVVLFVPAGMLWVAWFGARRRWSAAGWALAAGFALSLAIETTQALLLPDRVADVRDLVSNTLGALLGAVAAIVVRAQITSKRAPTAV